MGHHEDGAAQKPAAGRAAVRAAGNDPRCPVVRQTSCVAACDRTCATIKGSGRSHTSLHVLLCHDMHDFTEIEFTSYII